MNRDDLITIGQIASAHGVQGEMKLDLFTDFPERIYRLKDVYMVLADQVIGPYQVRGARLTGNRAIIALEGITSPETVKAYRGWELAITKDQVVPLPEGHYYYFQLVGLDVYSETGEYLGILKEVLPLPANDVYVVQTADKVEILLPATREVVRRIDLEAGRMVVHLLPGLC
ncbi:MAG: 16S rRNA processing protein RimM [Firmicutes bacterium]|jgi:16S rRNA processing protein RimM|nr:16S rRNA processing protein RimM [Bacillota bacterium]